MCTVYSGGAQRSTDCWGRFIYLLKAIIVIAHFGVVAFAVHAHALFWHALLSI